MKSPLTSTCPQKLCCQEQQTGPLGVKRGVKELALPFIQTLRYRNQKSLSQNNHSKKYKVIYVTYNKKDSLNI